MGLGLNELHADTSLFEKYKAIKNIINESRYKKSINDFNTRNMPIHWRILFCCCRYRLIPLVYCLLIMIKVLKSKI